MLSVMLDSEKLDTCIIIVQLVVCLGILVFRQLNFGVGWHSFALPGVILPVGAINCVNSDWWLQSLQLLYGLGLQWSAHC